MLGSSSHACKTARDLLLIKEAFARDIIIWSQRRESRSNLTAALSEIPDSVFPGRDLAHLRLISPADQGQF